MMKYKVLQLFTIVMGAVALLSSCVEESSTDYNAVEQVVFDEWMAQYNQGAERAYRQDDGYYIELISQGDKQAQMLADTTCWIHYDFTGYDLAGNVCLTRDDLTAWQQGSFSKQTRYVPYYRLSGESSYAILEGTELAFTSQLTIGDEKLYLYDGAEFKIFMPSSLVGEDGIEGQGGYEGQYSLTSGRPLIAKIKVTGVDLNPVESEGEQIDAFAKKNGGLTVSAARAEGEDDNAWINTVDTIAHFYINKTFAPKADASSFEYENAYTTGVPESPYHKGVAEVDKLINKALIERFGQGVTDGEVVGKDNDIKVWYIGRFLDGFIFDTNIDEVKEIIYNEVASEGAAISFNASTDEKSYIQSWFLSLPLLKYGQWAAIITNSTYAYGAMGQAGSTNVSTSGGSSDYSSYYDYYNMYNYYNGYYGGGMYGNYYNNYYNNYYGNYYDPYYNSSAGSSSNTVTTTTIKTEIPSYTPLIFEIYIEEVEDKDE